MSETLAHRGPDDAGVIERPEEQVGLGHRRLSIIDLSSAGHQPMANEDGTVWITYNGEVYNHERLRAGLESKGHRYRSRTDTETILHLYEEKGARCVEDLEGMFAFAIWDSRRRELFLARDRVGVKPLYYALLPSGFIFGSEVKALLAHPALRPELDEEAFYDFLTFAFTPAPKTMFSGIGKLAPAERITVSADGSMGRETWWNPLSPRMVSKVAGMSESEMVSELRRLLRASIRKRMMSDVPFGVFLSGGLDSSTNVALMSEMTSAPVRTYSTAPQGHSKYDELDYARLVADRFGTDHHQVLIDEDDLKGFIPQLVYHQDEPLADWTSVPQHFVSKLARDTGTAVVQVGEGADEIFHGYNGYAAHRRYAAPFQRMVPASFQAPIGRAAVALTTRLGFGIRHGEALYDAGSSRIPYWGGALCFRGPLKRQVVSREDIPDAYRAVHDVWDSTEKHLPGADLFQRMTYLELKQRLAELLLMRLDRIAMASSVEGREPFLDHELVEFALALPPEMKYRKGTGKHVLREAVRDLLPPKVLSRKKQGFGTPMVEWLRGDFGDRVQREVRASTLRETGLLDYERVDRIFAAHREGRGDWSMHLWNLFSISCWYDRWIAN